MTIDATEEHWLETKLKALDARLLAYEARHERQVAEAKASRDARDLEIECLALKVKELEAAVTNKMYIEAARVADAMAGDVEAKRQERWHATYNLALSGLLQARTASLTPEIELHQRAKKFADLAVGTLEVRTKSEQSLKVPPRGYGET